MTLEFRQSEFGAFKRSRRKWALQYRAAYVRKRNRPSTAGIGTLVHKGAEVYYLGGDWRAAMEQLWHLEAAKLEERYLEEYEKQLKLALVMVDGYIDWVAEEGIDAGIEVTGVERQLSVPFGQIAGHDITVTGKVDLEILDRYGLPRLRDFKTRDGLEPSPADRNDWQRKTYAVLRMMEDGTLFNGCDHVILRKVLRSSKSKPPYYGVHELTFTIEELRRHYTLLVAMLNEMVPLAAGLADGSIKLDDPRLYPNPHRDCSWDCKFLDVCPMFDDGGAWQWMLDEFFEVAVTLEETPE